MSEDRKKRRDTMAEKAAAEGSFDELGNWIAPAHVQQKAQARGKQAKLDARVPYERADSASYGRAGQIESEPVLRDKE
jgi:hypothetical protein